MKKLSAYHRHRLRRFLSIEDVRSLLEATCGETHVFVALAYGSGCRVSELTNLTWGDVDWEAGTIRVRGKGGKDRLVPVGRPATMTLRAWSIRPQAESGGICDEKNKASDQPRATQDAASLNVEPYRGLPEGCVGDPRAGGGLEGNLPQRELGVLRLREAGATGSRAAGRVFTVTPQAVRDRLKAVSHRLGWEPPATPHTIRHAYCTHLIDAGAPIPVVATLMGHTRWQTTLDVYYDKAPIHMHNLARSITVSLPRYRHHMISHPDSYRDDQFPYREQP